MGKGITNIKTRGEATGKDNWHDARGGTKIGSNCLEFGAVVGIGIWENCNEGNFGHV